MSDVNFNLTDHLKSRHMNLELHRPALDHVEGVATFLLWNLSHKMVGYQIYRPGADKKKNNDPKDGRYYTYRIKGTLSVWGVESLHAFVESPVVFLAEGIFDACRMTNRGYPALAVLSNNSGHDLSNWLSCLPNKRVVAVCDNNDAGRKLAKFGDYVETTPSAVDLGDSDESYVDYLIHKYCHG